MGLEQLGTTVSNYYKAQTENAYIYLFIIVFLSITHYYSCIFLELTNIVFFFCYVNIYFVAYY